MRGALSLITPGHIRIRAEKSSASESSPVTKQPSRPDRHAGRRGLATIAVPRAWSQKIAHRTLDVFAERYDQEPAVVAAIVIWGKCASLLLIPAIFVFFLA